MIDGCRSSDDGDISNLFPITAPPRVERTNLLTHVYVVGSALEGSFKFRQGESLQESG